MADAQTPSPIDARELGGHPGGLTPRLVRLYGGIAVALLASSLLLVLLTPRIRRWSGEG